MKVFYDAKPETLREIGDGRCVYCYNIKERINSEHADEHMVESITWECEQVEVYEPLTQNKILSAVISDRWDNNYEQKLLNECMSAQMGLYGGVASAEAVEKINRYQDFLNERLSLKRMVDEDCAALGIR